MIKRIAFFTVGFAFNRLVRMSFYEKIFPKDVEIYLITTDKYFGKEKENYQSKWSLNRTKIITLHYNTLTLPFQLRKFCEKEKIDRLINLGYHTGAFPLMIASLFKKRDFVINILTDLLNQYKYSKNQKEFFKEIATILLLFPLFLISKKIFLNDFENYRRVHLAYLTPRNKLNYLAAPVDTKLFRPNNKEKSRNKLKIPKDAKVVIFVGRIEYLKCSDIFRKIVSRNKDIQFIAIGRIIDASFSKLNLSNLRVIEKKSSKELVDYYNAADISFCVNRGTGGITLVAEESLSSGTPILISKEIPEKSDAIYQVRMDVDDIEKVIKKHLSLNDIEKAAISRKARNYAEKHYSEEKWKSEYIRSHLT